MVETTNQSYIFIIFQGMSQVSKDHSQHHCHHRPRGPRGPRGLRGRRRPRYLVTHHTRGAHLGGHEGQRGHQQDTNDGQTCHGEDGETRNGDSNGGSAESGNCGDGRDFRGFGYVWMECLEVVSWVFHAYANWNWENLWWHECDRCMSCLISRPYNCTSLVGDLQDGKSKHVSSKWIWMNWENWFGVSSHRTKKLSSDIDTFKQVTHVWRYRDRKQWPLEVTLHLKNM